MPMSPHRLALAGLVAVIVASLALGGAALAAAETGQSPSNPIVQTALKYNGTWQGECWPWVRRVVFEATGREMGFDYRQGYFEGGAVEVASKDAGPGDIIQIALDAVTGPDADYYGLHTLIVVANRGNGVFDTIDANQNFDGMVHLRAGYSPSESAARSGMQFHIYRFPTAANPNPKGSSASAPTSPSAPPALGERGVVTAGGDGLNLRAGPGVDQPVLSRLPDGMTVFVTSEQPTLASGRYWVSVRSSHGEGWVAAEFLKPPAGAPAAGSGAGRPLVQYRLFVPVLAATGGD